MRATFFILGWVAEREPALVQEIQRAGHEIACHSYAHRLVYNMSPDEFRRDLRRALAAIQNVTGEPVVAYRAPSFSITKKSLWALEILVEEGIRYDSSIFPARHDLYGVPSAERFPHEIDTPSGTLWEFPPSVHRVRNVSLPATGGGYFRLYPLWVNVKSLRRLNRRYRQPCMFYIHPWELDPDQPRIAASRRSRFRHYQNLHRTERRLNRLLGTLKFDTMTVALNSPDTARLATNSESLPHPKATA